MTNFIRNLNSMSSRLHRFVFILIAANLFFGSLLGQGLRETDSLQVEQLRDNGYAYEFSDSSKSIAFYNQALQQAQGSGLTTLEHLVWIDIGRLHFNLGHYLKAISFYQKAYEGAKTRKNELIKAKALQAIGNAYYMLGEPDESTRFLLDASRIQEKQNDSLNLAISFSTLASVFEDANQLNDALQYAQKAKSLSKALKKHRIYAGVCINTAIIYQKLQKKTEAMANIAEALQALPLIDEIAYKTSYFQNISGLYFDSGEYQKADQYADSALNYLKNQSASSHKTAIRMSKGLALLKLGRTGEAQPLLQEVLTHAESEKDYQVLREIHLSLAEAYGESGNWKEAYRQHTLYSAFHDSLLNEKAYQQAAELSAQYEAEKKAIAIEKLSRENELNTKVFKKQRALYLSIAGLVLLGFIASLLLYINQTRKTQLVRKTSELQTEQIKRLETEKQNIILDSMLKGEEQERSRVAKDLHDGVGSLLSGVKLSLSSMQGNLIVDSDQASVFERSLRQLDDAIREMRRVAHNMMPEALIQKGLLSAISGLCAGIVESGGPKVHFEQYGLEDRLPSSYEVILYRLVQEMINNALKYSSARQIIIQLSRQGNTLTLVCEDDGRGFDPALWENSSGIGFYTMKSRIEYLNGKVHLQTTPETGTSFLIEFQLSHD